VGDQWALESLVSGHGDHVVEDLRALVFDVRGHILGGEWWIGSCCSAIRNLNRIGKVDSDQASCGAERAELPITPYDMVVPVGR